MREHSGVGVIHKRTGQKRQAEPPVRSQSNFLPELDQCIVAAEPLLAENYLLSRWTVAGDWSRRPNLVADGSGRGFVWPDLLGILWQIGVPDQDDLVS
jgi:hypothetical protein